MAHDHTLGSHSLRSVPSNFVCSLLNFSEKNIPSTLIRGISLLQTVQSSKFKNKTQWMLQNKVYSYTNQIHLSLRLSALHTSHLG